MKSSLFILTLAFCATNFAATTPPAKRINVSDPAKDPNNYIVSIPYPVLAKEHREFDAKYRAHLGDALMYQAMPGGGSWATLSFNLAQYYNGQAQARRELMYIAELAAAGQSATEPAAKQLRASEATLSP
jgi:hypothetical protein